MLAGREKSAAEFALRWLLRFAGVVCLCALLAAFLPTNALSKWQTTLGFANSQLGPLEEMLARYGAMLCAGQGGLWLLLSINVHRYRAIIVYQSIFVVVLAVATFAMAWRQNLPLIWFIVDVASCSSLAIIALSCVAWMSRERKSSS